MAKDDKEIATEILLKIHDDELKEKDISKKCIKFLPKILEKNILNNEIYFKIKNNSTIATLKILISDIKNLSAEKIHIYFLIQKEKEVYNINNNTLSLTKIKEDFYIKNNTNLEECKDTDYITCISKRYDVNGYPKLFYIILIIQFV